MLGSTPQWQRLLVLLPAFVIAAGVVLAVVILLGRDLWQSFANSSHKRVIYAAVAALVILVVVLSVLGIELPREGG